MGASGVNGILEKWPSDRAGHGAWLNIHRVAVAAGVVLLLLHAIPMGTDLAPVRGFFGSIPGVPL